LREPTLLRGRPQGTAPASAGRGTLAAPLPRGRRWSDDRRACLCRLQPRRPQRQRLPAGVAGTPGHDREGD